jgi:hypothetical protein
MSALRLPPDSQEDIVTELAAHLEDGYQDELNRGITQSEACKRVLSSIQWNKLARGIRRATLKEQSMNNRTRILWLPAMVNLTTAAGLLAILQGLGVHPLMVQVGHLPVAFHIPWLLTLPLSAAAASFMARRAQAPPAVRILAGLAPSLVWLAAFVAMALEFELDRWQFPTGLPLERNYFLFSAFAWAVLPAVPLLLGTLPFLRESGLRKT